MASSYIHACNCTHNMCTHTHVHNTHTHRHTDIQTFCIDPLEPPGNNIVYCEASWHLTCIQAVRGSIPISDTSYSLDLLSLSHLFTRISLEYRVCVDPAPPGMVRVRGAAIYHIMKQASDVLPCPQPKAGSMDTHACMLPLHAHRMPMH